MSYKPIDLQVSLPRSVEMTPLQHQQQQRAALEQGLLGQQALKASEQNAKRSAKTESSSGKTISEREQRQRNRKESGAAGKSEEQAEAESKLPEHPYKGRHIDFTG